MADDYNTPDWTQFLNSNQPIAPNPSAMQPNTTTPASTYAPQNYQAQLQAMMAPYQQIAQRYSQPFNAFQPGSLLGRLIPQGAQGALSNGILTGSMVPQGQTIGQNISGVLGAVVGAQQFDRQRQMQGAMLPYEMLEPQLKLQDTLAQMQERQSEIPYRQAMEQRAMAQSDWYSKRVQEPNAAELQMRVAMGVVAPKDPNNPTPSEWGQIQTELDKQRQRATPPHEQLGGSAYAMAWSAAHPPTTGGVYSPKEAQQYMGDMQKYQTQLAGGRTTAEQSAKQSQVDVDNEVKLAETENMIPKPLTSSQFAEQNKFNPKYLQDPNGLFQSYINQAVPQYNQQKASYDSKVSQYRDAARKDPNLRWHDYLQQSASPSSTGASPSAPSNRPPGW